MEMFWDEAWIWDLTHYYCYTGRTSCHYQDSIWTTRTEQTQKLLILGSFIEIRGKEKLWASKQQHKFQQNYQYCQIVCKQKNKNLKLWGATQYLKANNSATLYRKVFIDILILIKHRSLSINYPVKWCSSSGIGIIRAVERSSSH